MIVYREQRRRVRTADVLRRIAEASGFARLMEEGELEAGIADVNGSDPSHYRQGVVSPEWIDISVPEGFAYYALDPELYRIAARRFEQECRPDAVAVIGIRSIGTTLSRIVQDALSVPAERWTVRPHGHPWDRRLAVSQAVERQWRAWSGWFAIVDEGPGLSGTSFASVAEYLSGLGVPDDRIVFFPSWQPDVAALVSERARTRWHRHRSYTADFEELGQFPGAEDLSGGKWRDLRGIWPAVQPQHECRKYLREGRLYKFAGYGRYGAAKLERARILRAFIPRVFQLDNGFLEMEWLPMATSRPSLSFAARYLAAIPREFATGAAANTEQLAEMIAVNAGMDPPPRPPSAEAVLLDGRMLPQEWLGNLKTDALDHHDDHFFPGPQDIAWDVAAFTFEFELSAAEETHFLECYRRASGDRDIAARLPFYRAAYLAFRYGYCELAVRALGSLEDATRFLTERERYEKALRSSLWTKTADRLSA